MGCDHTGPEDVIRMAEEHLDARGRAPCENGNLRFGYGENIDTMWKSIYIEVERRDGEWVVTRLDRNSEELDAAELGLRQL